MRAQFFIKFLIISGSLFSGFSAFADASSEASASTVTLNSIAQNLKLDDLNLKAVQVSDQMTTTDDRETHQIQLVHSEVGTIQITLNGPKNFTTSSAKYSVLFVTAGFMEPTKILQALQNKNLIVVSYTYPASREDFAKDPSLVTKTVRIIPGQIALALEWLKARKYVDSDRLSVLGLSLGSLFTPVALQLASLRSITPAATIFAYSSDNLNQTMQKILSKNIQEPTLTMVYQLMSGITNTYDPKTFLPGLRGPFLAIYGMDDQLIPKADSLEQYTLLPNQKNIVWLDGTHISNDQPELIKKMAQKILEFLSQSNLL